MIWDSVFHNLFFLKLLEGYYSTIYTNIIKSNGVVGGNEMGSIKQFYSQLYLFYAG